MKENQKYLLSALVLIIIIIAMLYFYSRKVKKHPIYQRVQATADLKAQLFKPLPEDKTKLGLIDEYVNIKQGEIIGYLYIKGANGYYAIKGKKGIYIPKESSRIIE